MKDSSQLGHSMVDYIRNTEHGTWSLLVLFQYFGTSSKTKFSTWTKYDTCHIIWLKWHMLP